MAVERRKSDKKVAASQIGSANVNGVTPVHEQQAAAMTRREAKRIALQLIIRGARADVREARGALGAPPRERKDDLTEEQLGCVRREAEAILSVMDRRADRLRSYANVNESSSKRA